MEDCIEEIIQEEILDETDTDSEAASVLLNALTFQNRGKIALLQIGDLLK